MQLGGELEIEEPMDRVRAVLVSPEEVAKCLPHLVSWEAKGNELKAVFRASIGGVVEYLSRLTARARIEIREIDEKHIDYAFEGSIARARYSGVIHVALEETSKGTRVRWSADIELGKTLQMLSRFVNVDELVNRIVREVTESIIRCTRSNPAQNNPRG